MNPSSNHKCPWNTAHEALYFGAAALVLFLFLFPYWLFGEFSALGWFDEWDAIIPWYFARSKVAGVESFLYGFSGGSGGAGECAANEVVSLYRSGLVHLPVWVAGLALRWGGLFALFSGVYTFARLVSGTPRRLLAFAAGLFICLGNPTQYGWSLGGLGWDAAAIPWLGVCFFGRFVNPASRYLLAVAVCAVVCVSSSPVYLSPMFLGFAGYCFVFHRPSDWRALRPAWVGIGLLYLVFMLANWYPGLIGGIIQAGTFSARILGTLEPVHQSNGLAGFLEGVGQGLGDFVESYHRYLGHLVWYSLAALVLLSRRLSELRERSLLLLVTILGPIILEVALRLTHLPFISAYRWSLLLMLLPLLMGVHLTRASTAGYERLACAVLLLFSVWGAFCNCRESLVALNAYTGVGSVKAYAVLRKLEDKTHSFRLVSAGYLSMTPVYYGLDTFDGFLKNSPERRNYFAAFGVYDPPRETLHTHRLYFYDFPKGLDLALLRRVNVRYVASDHPIDNPALRFVLHQPAVYANERPYFLRSILSPFFNGLRLLAPLYLYEFRGEILPRFFAAQSVKSSGYSFRDPGYYRDLKSTNPKAVLFASEEKAQAEKWNLASGLKVGPAKFDEGGVEVSVSPEGGTLVFNQVFTPFWQAFCSGSRIPLAPANGVMMAVAVPPGCKSVDVRYLPPRF